MKARGSQPGTFGTCHIESCRVGAEFWVPAIDDRVDDLGLVRIVPVCGVHRRFLDLAGARADLAV